MTTTTAVPAARAPSESPRRRPASVGRRQTRAAWLFMAPSLVVLAIFVVYPMTQALYLSFTDYDVLTPARWIGLGNYRELFSDEAFLRALRNTLYYAAVTTPVSVAL